MIKWNFTYLVDVKKVQFHFIQYIQNRNLSFQQRQVPRVTDMIIMIIMVIRWGSCCRLQNPMWRWLPWSASLALIAQLDCWGTSCAAPDVQRVQRHSLRQKSLLERTWIQANLDPRKDYGQIRCSRTSSIYLVIIIRSGERRPNQHHSKRKSTRSNLHHSNYN